MVRRLIAALVAASVFFAQALPAWSQAGLAAHSIPIAPGRGSSGWNVGGPCAAGQSLVWVSGAASDPTCSAPGVSSITIGGTPLNNNVANGILYGDGSAIVQQISPTANGVVIYNSSGVPVSSLTLSTAVQANITQTSTLTGGATGAGFTINLGTSTITGVLSPTNGGTGVNNGAKTITLGASFTTTGTGAPTLAFPSTPQTYTYPPIADTLGALGTAETWTALQTFNSAAFTTAPTGAGITALFASPPPIGATAPNTGSFTSLALTSALALIYGGTGSTNASGARVNLNIDQLTKPGNVNYTILSTDRTVAHSLVTHPLVDSLPLAASVNAGQEIVVVDMFGQFSATNTLSLSASGSDSLNGVGSTVVINSAFGGVRVKSDGVSVWSFPPGGGGGGGGGVTTVNCGKGTVCSPITSTGTVTAPGALLAAGALAGAI